MSQIVFPKHRRVRGKRKENIHRCYPKGENVPLLLPKGENILHILPNEENIPSREKIFPIDLGVPNVVYFAGYTDTKLVLLDSVHFWHRNFNFLAKNTLL